MHHCSMEHLWLKWIMTQHVFSCAVTASSKQREVPSRILSGSSVAATLTVLSVCRYSRSDSVPAEWTGGQRGVLRSLCRMWVHHRSMLISLIVLIPAPHSFDFLNLPTHSPSTHLLLYHDPGVQSTDAWMSGWERPGWHLPRQWRMQWGRAQRSGAWVIWANSPKGRSLATRSASMMRSTMYRRYVYYMVISCCLWRSSCV